MLVQFDDGPAAVLLDEAGRVERGKPKEVSDELGKQLLEQGWRCVGGSKKNSSTKKPKTKAASKGATKKTPPDTGLTKED